MDCTISSTSAPTTAPKRLAVIGAGPIGLESALYAQRCGFAVRIFEAADEIAPHLRSCQHLPLYSCWGNLRTSLGCEAVKMATAGAEKLPRVTLHPTAEEFLRRYIEPISATLPPRTLWLGTRVVALTRPYIEPSDFPHAADCEAHSGSTLRLLTRHSFTGEERTWGAEIVLDCTAGGRTPAWLGPGGIPAIGEMGCPSKIYRHTPDILGRDRAAFGRKKTLLVGDGTSAAASANQLSELAESQEGTQFFWAVTHDGDLPCAQPRGQEASQRRSMELSRANLLVKAAKPYLLYSNKTFIEEVRYNCATGSFFVTLQIDRQTKRYQFDNIIANVGQRREDLYINRLDPSDPNFFKIGASDYTLDDHAIRHAHLEIRDAFREICNDPGLDLYRF